MPDETNNKPDLLGPRVSLAIGLIALAASLYWLYAGGALDQRTTVTTGPSQYYGMTQTSYKTSMDPRGAMVAVAISFLWTAISAWVLVKRIKKH